MADNREAMLTLAYVDAELEKSAGFVRRNLNRIKGFAQGYKNVGQLQNAEHLHNVSQAGLKGTQAASRPGFFQRLEQRVEGGMARGRAEGQLHDLQQHQQNMNASAQQLEHLTGGPAQYHEGPNYQNMTGADLMHLQRDPQGFAQAQQHQQQAQAASQQPYQAGRQAYQNWGWVPKAMAGAAAGVGGMYLWNRFQQPQQPYYGNPYYGDQYYQKMGSDVTEKTAIIHHFVPHVVGNLGAMAAHAGSNIQDVLAHRAFQLGLQGKELHPTRVKAMRMTLGPESLAAFEKSRALGQSLSHLSPEGQRLAVRGMLKGYDLSGLPLSAPVLGDMRNALEHHLAGTTPTREGGNVAAKSYARILDDLTQHTYDPKEKQNILQRGLGHLRGALPAIPVALSGVFNPMTPIAHFGINKAREVFADSQFGQNKAKDLLRNAIEGHQTPGWQRALVGAIGSPAYYEPERLGHAIRQSNVALPAAMLMEHELANRAQKHMNQPHMLAAAQPNAPAQQPLGSGAGAPGTGAPSVPPSPARQGGFLRNTALPFAGAAGLAGLGYTAYRGSQAANEQSARIQDHISNSAHNMSNPLPPMTVTASYEEFCEEKTANVYAPVYPSMQNALSTSMAQQLASKFIGDPIDAAHKVLTKKLYDEPKQQAAYEEAISGDEMLQEAHRTNPKGLKETFSTLKTFAPSMAKNPQATKSFLRQATMSGMHGGGPDFATIRLLAETEKFIQNSKGRGSNS